MTVTTPPSPQPTHHLRKQVIFRRYLQFNELPVNAKMQYLEKYLKVNKTRHQEEGNTFQTVNLFMLMGVFDMHGCWPFDEK